MADKQRSHSGAFLIELLIVIAVFALCCAAGIRVLSVANGEMDYAEQLTNAKHIAADIAERYKAGEELSSISSQYDAEGGSYRINYAGESGKTLMASLNERTEGTVNYLDIKISDDNYVYTEITCAKMGGDAYE